MQVLVNVARRRQVTLPAMVGFLLHEQADMFRGMEAAIRGEEPSEEEVTESIVALTGKLRQLNARAQEVAS